jgi:integrase
MVRDLRFDHIDAIISKARMKTIDDRGRAVGGVEAARKLRKELRRFFGFAVKLGWFSKNPVEESQAVKVAPSERSTGYYTWSEEDIARYRARWPLGTKQRLAMELILWTDQRKVDAIHLGRQHVRDGKFVIRQSKTGKRLVLPIAQPLAAAIDAMPASDAMCFIVTEWGRPFSVKGFGGWFREQCDAAGLPRCTAHGLRKATMRRMAELEMPNKSMKSVSGHSKDDEVARYTEAANQERLAESAIRRLAEWEMSNLGSRLDTKSG